jgi:hypothetical protein
VLRRVHVFLLAMLAAAVLAAAEVSAARLDA